MTLQRRFMVAALCAVVVFAGAAAPGQAQQQEGPAVGLRLVADGFTSPVALVAAADDSGRRFIVDQVGVIRVLGADGNVLSQPFLDLRNRIVPLMPEFDERGLLRPSQTAAASAANSTGKLTSNRRPSGPTPTSAAASRSRPHNALPGRSCSARRRGLEVPGGRLRGARIRPPQG